MLISTPRIFIYILYWSRFFVYHIVKENALLWMGTFDGIFSIKGPHMWGKLQQQQTSPSAHASGNLIMFVSLRLHFNKENIYCT